MIWRVGQIEDEGVILHCLSASLPGLPDSSYNTKAKLNNCVIFRSKYVLNFKTCLFTSIDFKFLSSFACRWANLGQKEMFNPADNLQKAVVIRRWSSSWYFYFSCYVLVVWLLLLLPSFSPSLIKELNYSIFCCPFVCLQLTSLAL